ncbi:TPA: hypothetical protein NKV05_003165 [Vibrio parahaemolyticus]|nr:hypothetical protein [Vibrio parahaemolyticus]
MDSKEPTEDEIKAFLKDVKDACKKHNLALNGVNADSGMYASIEILRPEQIQQDQELHRDWGIWAIDAISQDLKLETKFVEVDLSHTIPPLWEYCGFSNVDEFEQFLYIQLEDKKAFIYDGIKERFGGFKLAEESVPGVCVSKLEMKFYLKYLNSAWVDKKRKEFKGDKKANEFDHYYLLNWDVDGEGCIEPYLKSSDS